MSQKPLHVLVLATWYPHGGDTLIGIYHKQFCKALAEAGVKVNMLHVDAKPISTAPRYPFMKKTFKIKEESYDTHFRLMLNRRRISEKYQQDAYVKTMRKLYKAYEAENGKPDLLHAQVMIPAGHAACVLGKEFGIPVMITEHASYYQRFFTGWHIPYMDLVAQNAAKITCVGKHMVDYLQREKNIPAQVLPNIVDISIFHRPRKKKTDSTLRFVTVCALRHGKNIRKGLQAFAKLRSEGRLTDFHYTVVGDGYLLDGYKKNAKELGLTDCVTFAGQKTHEEIAEILTQTDVMLVTSNGETFCIPAVEAAAAGVPVVSTKCGGPEGFLTPEVSEFCEVDNEESMADAIMRMVDRLQEVDEGAVRAVAKPFDSAAVAAQAISYYNEILQK